MNNPQADAESKSPDNASVSRAQKRRKRELIIFGIALVVGFIVLPLLIFAVGTLLLGPYAGGKSIGAFIAEFYGNLARGAPRTWFIGFSPYLAIWVVRLTFRSYRFRRSEQEPPSQPPQESAQSKSANGRREPFISA